MTALHWNVFFFNFVFFFDGMLQGGQVVGCRFDSASSRPGAS